MEVIKFETLESKLMEIRDTLVLLDKDVANLYEIEPKRLREQLKRNIEKALQTPSETILFNIEQKAEIANTKTDTILEVFVKVFNEFKTRDKKLFIGDGNGYFFT